MAISMMPMLTSERKREAIRRRLEGLEIQKTPKTSISKPEIPMKLWGYIPGLFCNVCLQPGHPEHRCRLLKSCKLGQKLGPDYVIVCRCCWEENAHPADANVRRCAARIFCANCSQIGDHMTSDCKFPDGGPVTSSGSESESESR